MLRVIVAVAVATSLSACATITRGTEENVQFLSEPPGAAMTTNRGHSCMTPCTIAIARTEQFDATFSMPGCQTQRIRVTTQVGGGGAAGLVGNALVGGIIGIGVDAASGAAMDHKPNPVAVTLQPVGSVPKAGRRERRSRPTT